MCRSVFLLAAAVSLVAVHPALTADYDAPVIFEDVPNLVPVEIGTGWYLRGDIGYHIDTEPRDTFTYRTFDGVNYGAEAFDTGSLGEDITFGIGVGYSFTDLLRADVTVDRFTSSFSGSTSFSAPCPGGPAGTACRSDDASELTGYSVMLNGYVDLGTVVGFTPYVGAGAGYTYAHWDDLESRTFCVDGATGCAGTGSAGTITRAGESDWRFTYALMAGVTYDMSDNMKLDVGYRYRRIDGGDMFGWDNASAAAGASGSQGEDPGLSSHEIRVGLRLELW